MGRWKKDETEYTVNLNHDQRRGCIAIIPKPIVEKLGKPDKIQFVIIGKKVMIDAE